MLDKTNIKVFECIYHFLGFVNLILLVESSEKKKNYYVWKVISES